MVGSYMIADQKHRLMAGHGWVTSAGQDMSSLRAEMGGLLGGMAAISHILQLDPTTIRLSQITLDVYMDNSALISWINQWRHGGPSSTLLTDYDLIQETMKLADELQINLVPHHVKAHQDDDCPYDLLPWQAKLNVDCDLQAGQKMHNMQGGLQTLHSTTRPQSHLTNRNNIHYLSLTNGSP